MIGKSLGQYRLVEQIGSGGMGVVFRARDEKLNRDVALKVLLQGALCDDVIRASFRREAETLARLNHPCIAAVYDFGSDGEIDYLVMEHVQGITLADVIAEEGRLPQERALQYAEQIAHALQEAHAQRIVHQDLKPGNVMVTPRGTVKILDFGVAQLLPASDGTDVTELATQLFQIAGTLSYMSPEQLEGKAIDGRSDVYAAGVLLYEMLTGQRPHTEGTLPALTQAILNAEPPPPRTVDPDISPELETVVLRALAKDRDRRYESAQALAADLARVRGGGAPAEVLADTAPGLVKSTPTPHDAAGATQRARTPATGRARAAIGAAVVLALAAAAWWWWPDASPGGAGDSTTRSLIVMPATVVGGEGDDFLADAIPGSISTHLSQVAGLDTKVPPSRLEVEAIGGNLETVAQAYRVEVLVLSTVTIQASRIVLNLQVMDAASRSVLWSRELTGTRDEFLELSRAAAAGIRGALRPADDAAPLVSNAGTSAGELALRQGLYMAGLFRSRGRPEHRSGAREALERALDLDPDRAEAAAELARLHAALVVTGEPPAEIVPEIRRWGRMAVEIDPTHSTGWAVLSEAEQIDPAGDYATMLDYALRAANHGDRDAYAHARLAYALSRRSFLLSLEASRAARRLDPLELTGPLAEAISLAALGRTAEAHARIDGVLSIEPEMPYAQLVRGLVNLIEGDGESAARIVEGLRPAVEEGRLRPEWLTSTADYVTLERTLRTGSTDPEDLAAQARMIALAEGRFPFPRWEGASAEVAPLLARFGRTDEAIRLMRLRAELGVTENLEFLALAPDFGQLRSDPRFQQILDDARPGFDELMSLLEAARRRGELPAYLETPMGEVAALVANTTRRE